jgi:alpha-D-xyloside xylohydrolase
MVKKHSYFYFFLGSVLCLGLFACHSSPVDKNDDGVTIHLKVSETNPVKTIRLQVINEKIIHVSTSPVDTLASPVDPMAAYSETMTNDWSYSYTENDVILKTATLTVTACLLTGEIVFSDAHYGVLSENDSLIYRMEQKPADYYFIQGNTMDEIISGYRTVTGKAQVMPKWAMGFWQSRESYQTQDELLNVLREFREQEIPIDNIVLDGTYRPEKERSSYDFDSIRFPDAAAMIEEIHDLDARFMISVLPDWEQMSKKLYYKGVDAWWIDASADSIVSEWRQAKEIYEGQREADNYHRIVLFMPSGFAGSQRYAVVVRSGTVASRWEEMKAQITAGLNFSISGNPYWTMDNGGSCVEKQYQQAPEDSEEREEWRELNVRWHQFGAFAPLFHTHGSSPYREIWNIAPEKHPAYRALLYYTRLRYRLMPYIYTLAGMTYFNDYTIMRPLVMNFESDAKVLSISDQYLFGPGLMVCPVYEYKARSREVYFPEGTDWYDLYSGRRIEGGQRITVEAPYERMPLFAPAGTILPVGETIRNTKLNQKDLTLYIYGGKDGSFSLYEDEGTNYNYEKGIYSLIPFNYNEADTTLTIGERKGKFPRMNKIRNFRIIKVNTDCPAGIDGEASGISILYDGRAQTVSLR